MINPIPFVIDIDRKKKVWNDPYDQGYVRELASPPESFNPILTGIGGRVAYFEAGLKGTTFHDQARMYQFWIKNTDDGSVMKSRWIEGDDSKVNPDFSWRPHPIGDLTQKENWVTNRHRQSSPNVKAEDVYEIYVRSLDRGDDSTWNHTRRWFGGLFS
ncbi:MAG: hypothetical protein VYA34_02190 [Myxococcota bacterium]|nr:hypothetical protein [Myxococcota bacterium]